MSSQPKCAGAIGWIYAGIPPPSHFIAAAVELTVVTSTQRNSEFIAHLAPKGAVLREMRNPTQGGHGFRGKADTIPMIADSR